MAYYGPGSRFVYAFGYDLGADGMLAEITPPGKAAGIQDITGPIATRPVHRPTGYVDNDDLVFGLWQADGADSDPDTQVLIDALQTLSASSRAIVFGQYTDVLGKPFTGVLAFDMSVKPVTPKAELTKVEVTVRPTGGVEDGIILHPKGEETAADDTEATSYDAGTQAAALTISSATVANPTVITTSTDHGLTTGDTVLIAGSDSTPSLDGSHTVTVTGATTFTVAVNVTIAATEGTATLTSTRNGGAGWLEVFAVTFTDITVVVRDSMDDSTFADLVTFVAASALGAQRVAVTGVVNRYLATSWTVTDTGASTFWAGFYRA